MPFARIALLALALAACCDSARADCDLIGLPLIEETVDEICILKPVNADSMRVCFFRDGKLLATRLYVDDMRFFVRGDRIACEWQDWWTAERVVYTTRVSFYEVYEDPTEIGQNGLWHCQNRRMADLRAP